MPHPLAPLRALRRILSALTARARFPRFAGVVHADDGVRFIALATDRHRLVEQVAGYVAGRAAHVLWPDEAAAVSRALDARNPGSALNTYFSAVGGRWDAESLTIAELSEHAFAERVGGAYIRLSTHSRSPGSARHDQIRQHPRNSRQHAGR